MTKITTITQADVDFMIAQGTLAAHDAPTAERPMLEIHNATSQAYPRTVANYERTRRMAATTRGLEAKLDREYTVYKLV